MKHSKNQKGQSILEYVLLVGLIAIGSLAAIQGFGETLKNKIEAIESKTKKALKIRR